MVMVNVKFSKLKVFVSTNIFILTMMLFMGGTLHAEWMNISTKGKISKSSSRSIKNVKASELKINKKVLNKEVLRDAYSKMSTEKSFKLSLNLSGFDLSDEFVNSENYKKLQVPEWNAQPVAGKPAVPMKVVLIEIPADTKAKAFVINKKFSTLKKVNLVPTQPAAIESIDQDPPFTKDKKTYSKNSFYPADNIIAYKNVYIRDKAYLEVVITPFQVNPVTKVSKVTYQLEIEVVLTDSKPGAKLNSPALESLNGNKEKYMVLFDDQFNTNAKLKEFIEWKRKKGLDVVPVKTSEIPAVTAGAPTIDELIKYMRGLSSADYPEYLMILGDQHKTTGVPAKFIKTKNGGYSDLYTACRTTTDNLPDLFYGRLPAKDSASLTRMLSKVLEMDRNPVNSKMYDKVIVAGQIQDSDYNNIADRFFCETADLIKSYFRANTLGYTYDVASAIVNPENVDKNCKWRTTSILWKNSTQPIGTRIFNEFVTVPVARGVLTNGVNSGVALIQHRDHGYYKGWGDPKYVTEDVNALRNGSNRPIVMSINCSTGSYHMPTNFTRAWLDHASGGAYAVFSATDVSYSGYNDYLTHGFYMAFLSNYRSYQRTSTSPDWTSDLPAPASFVGTPGESLKLGQIMNYGKSYMYQAYGSTSSTARMTLEIFHVFGDPEAAIRLHAPKNFNVSHPNTLMLANSSITVKTGVAGALVCLYNETLGVQEVQKTDSLGNATLSINPGSATNGDVVSVTVSHPNYRPYEGKITIGYTQQMPLLSVTTQGEGSVTPANGSFVLNSSVTLKAVPANGWVFVEWKGDALGTTSTIDVKMTKDMNITAVFQKVQGFTLTVNIVGNGTVSPTAREYVAGTVVPLIADPDIGWLFKGWSGDIIDLNPATEVIMDSNKVVTATFKKDDTVVIVPEDPNAKAKPGTPSLTKDNWGFKANYSIIMNMWWGNNGTIIKLYEDGVLIRSEDIIFNSPQAQIHEFVFKNKAAGTYVYKCELVNQFGATVSKELTYIVK
jgi:hypothetical protein